MPEGLRKRVIVTVSAGAVIGVVEVVLAISFAVLVFSGFLEDARPSGIGIYLVAASLTLAILAWRAGVRGVVGSVQDAAAAVLAIVAASAALDTFGGVDQAFLTVVGVVQDQLVPLDSVATLAALDTVGGARRGIDEAARVVEFEDAVPFILRLPSLVEALLHRHALRQVARLIHIRAAPHRDVVGQ